MPPTSASTCATSNGPRSSSTTSRRPSVANEAAKPLRLGGMALANGLLVHGPTHWAAAIRSTDGQIAVASGAKPRLRARAGSVPGLRGLAGLAEAVAVI